MASKKKDKKELALAKQSSLVRNNEQHHEELTYHDYISDEMINSWQVTGDMVDYLVDQTMKVMKNKENNLFHGY